MPSISALQSALGRPGFALLVIVVVLATLLIVRSVRERGRPAVAGVLAGGALAVTLLGVGSLTLPGLAPGAEPVLILDPVEGAWGWDAIAWRPVFDNVALFFPVGAFVAAVAWRLPAVRVWSVCVVLSISIEAFQYAVAAGRVANSADVLANASGAALGVLLAHVLGAHRGGRAASPLEQRRHEVRS